MSDETILYRITLVIAERDLVVIAVAVAAILTAAALYGAIFALAADRWTRKRQARRSTS